MLWSYSGSLILAISCWINACLAHEELPRLLLISFDGFRWDYLKLAQRRGKTPNFDSLINDGVVVREPGIKNAFITKTMPNHYTIVTGLYEENHGIVANSFYDPVFNETFGMSSESSKNIKWWNGTGSQRVEPIWVTNDAEGGEHGHRASGVFSWPGSEVIGYEPKYHGPPFNKSISFNERVDAVVGWFTQRHGINFGAIYYHEPDETGHKFGPESNEVGDMIIELDKGVGYLINKLKEKNIFYGTNIIITSDHGMQKMDNNVYLDEYIDSSLYTMYGDSPVVNVVPKEGHEEEVYQILKTIPNLLVYKKQDINERFHYKNNRRILNIVAMTEPGYRLCHNKSSCDQLPGNHGFDNDVTSMHPIFIAHGPVFKKHYEAMPFDTVDIYPLICQILEIEPRPNDGHLEAIKHILVDGDNLNITVITFLLIVGFAALISGIWCIGACRLQRISIRRGADSPWKPLPNNFPLRSDGSKPLLVEEDEEDAA